MNSHMQKLLSPLEMQSPLEEARSSMVDLHRRLQGMDSGLELERLSRKSDWDLISKRINDVMESVGEERRLRQSELEGLRGNIKSLSLSIAAGATLEPDTGKSTADDNLVLMNSLAQVHNAVDAERELCKSITTDLNQNTAMAAHRGSNTAEAKVASSPCNASSRLSQDMAEVVTRVRGLAVELRTELCSRIDIASADLRGEMAASSASFRGDIAAVRAELQNDFSLKLDYLSAELHELKKPGVEHMNLPHDVHQSAVAAGQVSEVLRIMHVISSSSEVLAERMCDETAARKEADQELHTRVTVVEDQLGIQITGLPGAPDESTTDSTEISRLYSGLPEEFKSKLQKQTLISDDLKVSLEKLVSRVDILMKPEEARPSRSRSFLASNHTPRTEEHSPSRSLRKHSRQSNTVGVMPEQSQSADRTRTSSNSLASGRVSLMNVRPCVGPAVGQNLQGVGDRVQTSLGRVAIQSNRVGLSGGGQTSKIMTRLRSR